MAQNQDFSNVYRVSREYYAADPWVRAFTDVHYVLSLTRATIFPHPQEDWLEAMSSAVIDYWKVGELFLGQKDNKFVYCDPCDVVTDPAADDGNKFVLPNYWVKEHKHEPIFMQNKSDKYAYRGLPVTYRQLTNLSRMRANGMPQQITANAFGFGDEKSKNKTIHDIVTRVSIFRKQLGMALNRFWPHLNIDMYIIGVGDAVVELKKFKFLQ